MGKSSKTDIKEFEALTTELEMYVIMRYLKFGGNTKSKDWLRMSVILKYNHFFNSQSSYFPKTVKKGEGVWFVEKSKEVEKSKYRIATHAVWRLKRDINTYSRISDLCFGIDSFLLVDKRKNNSLCVDAPYSQYFKTSDYVKFTAKNIKQKFMDQKIDIILSYSAKR